jgi:hypothetical protein
MSGNPTYQAQLNTEGSQANGEELAVTLVRAGQLNGALGIDAD